MFINGITNNKKEDLNSNICKSFSEVPKFKQYSL